MSRHYCRTPGCPVLVTEGYCPQHQQAHERLRGSAAARGYGRQHQRFRAVVLARDPLCVCCLSLGRVSPSRVADHVVPVNAGGHADDPANGQGLCDHCHNVKRAAESRGRQIQVRQRQGFADIGPLGPRPQRLGSTKRKTASHSTSCPPVIRGPFAVGDVFG